MEIRREPRYAGTYHLADRSILHQVSSSGYMDLLTSCTQAMWFDMRLSSHYICVIFLYGKRITYNLMYTILSLPVDAKSDERIEYSSYMNLDGSNHSPAAQT